MKIYDMLYIILTCTDEHVRRHIGPLAEMVVLFGSMVKMLRNGKYIEAPLILIER